MSEHDYTALVFALRKHEWILPEPYILLAQAADAITALLAERDAQNELKLIHHRDWIEAEAISAKYRAALEWYASDLSWIAGNDRRGPRIAYDRGKRAKLALTESTGS